MITIETKNKALRVANQLRDLLADYSELMTNDEINQFISHQLVHVPTGGELGSLASLLQDVKNEQRCEHCNNLLMGKGRGSKQRFCSDDCRFKFHREAKSKKKAKQDLAEARAEAVEAKADDKPIVIHAIEEKRTVSQVATLGIKEAVKVLNSEGNKVRRDSKTGLYHANGTKRTEADIIAWAMDLRG